MDKLWSWSQLKRELFFSCIVSCVFMVISMLDIVYISAWCQVYLWHRWWQLPGVRSLWLPSFAGVVQSPSTSHKQPNKQSVYTFRPVHPVAARVPTGPGWSGRRTSLQCVQRGSASGPARRGWRWPRRRRNLPADSSSEVFTPPSEVWPCSTTICSSSPNFCTIQLTEHVLHLFRFLGPFPPQ